MSQAVDKDNIQAVPAPKIEDDAHKGKLGKVLCLAGSETMPGAAILVLRATQRAGAGLVTLATFDKSIIHSAAIAIPEAVYIDLSRSKDLVAGRLPSQLADRDDDVRIAGPGMGRGGRTDELIRCLVEDDFSGPLVLDADALNVIGDTPEVLAGYCEDLIVTPHPGEAARLLGTGSISSNSEERIESAILIARAASAICVLKGPQTVVTDGQRVFVCPRGNPGMATAGAGDVLAGVIGAYVGYSRRLGLPEWGVFEATCSAVHVHSLAGDLAAKKFGYRALIASSIVDYLCVAQMEFEATSRP
ncbi:MAG: hydroxyethylthiazole kinase-like uncharacterized protein yjeF [Planctomycetota bacterium]|jgi:hydroxyethylthiazole kinase-like uncharacterized protein yjeF